LFFCLLIGACYHGTTRPQFVNTEDGLRLCRVDANI